MQFSTYPTIYNLMSYNQEYNEQPIYELDFQYSEDSESDNTSSKPVPQIPITFTETYHWGLTQGS